VCYIVDPSSLGLLVVFYALFDSYMSISLISFSMNSKISFYSFALILFIMFLTGISPSMAMSAIYSALLSLNCSIFVEKSWLKSVKL